MPSKKTTKAKTAKRQPNKTIGASGSTDLHLEISILHQIIEIISTAENLPALLHNIARALSHDLAFDSCLIYLLDSNSGDLLLSGAWPPHPYHVGKLRLESGEGITGWVAEHQQPVAISRHAFKDTRFKVFQNLPEDRFEACLSVPILLKGKPIGVINLQKRKPHVITPRNIKLITSISTQIAMVIEKTRFFQMASDKARQLETVSRLSQTIVSSTYLQEILHLIVTMTAQMMNSKICALMLLDKEKQELSIAATQSLSEEYRKKPPLKVGQSVAGRAVKLKEPLAVMDVTKEPGYMYPDIARREGLVSMVAVPMLIKGVPIGVINCYSTEPHRYTQEEINILQTIANQAAIAIENTRLLEEYQTVRDSLETRKTVERAKGLLMKQKNIGEDEAFQFIQKQAMNLRRTMKEVAEAILLSDGLKNNYQ